MPQGRVQQELPQGEFIADAHQALSSRVLQVSGIHSESRGPGLRENDRRVHRGYHPEEDIDVPGQDKQIRKEEIRAGEIVPGWVVATSDTRRNERATTTVVSLDTDRVGTTAGRGDRTAGKMRRYTEGGHETRDNVLDIQSQHGDRRGSREEERE